MSLKERIEETIHRHPDTDDQDIAKMIWEEDHPGEAWENKGPSEQYVGRVRRKTQALAGPPEFEVEIPEEDELLPDYEEGEEIPEEPEIPFQEEFEPPEIEYPEPEVEPPVEGPTVDEIQFLVVFTFDKLADWTRFDGWRFSTDAQGRLTDKNEKRFIKITSRMADKYLPEIFELYFLEVMFCYTAIMLIGGKAAAYRTWRKNQQPLLESTIVETEQPEEAEIPEAEEQEPSTDAESEREPRPLLPGEKAHGEAGFMKRLRRQPG